MWLASLKYLQKKLSYPRQHTVFKFIHVGGYTHSSLFLLFSIIPVPRYITLDLSTYQFMGICAISTLNYYE